MTRRENLAAAAASFPLALGAAAVAGAAARERNIHEHGGTGRMHEERSGEDEIPAAATSAGKRMPAPELEGIVPPPVRLAELCAKPVVNFWASWCVPCRDEAPLLDASARAHAGEVVFLGINIQDLREDALALSREFGTPYVSVRDRDNRTYEADGLTGVPETYYRDPEGRIVAHSPGAVSRASLDEGIAAARGGGTR